MNMNNYIQILAWAPEALRDQIERLASIAYVTYVNPNSYTVNAYSPVFGEIFIPGSNFEECRRGDEIEIKVNDANNIVILRNITLEREKQEFEKRIINEMVPETFPLEQFKEWRDDPFSFKNQKQR